MTNTKLQDTLIDIIETYKNSDDPITKNNLMNTLNYILTLVKQDNRTVYKLIDNSDYKIDYIVAINCDDEEKIQKDINRLCNEWYEMEDNDDELLDTYGYLGNYIFDKLDEKYVVDVLTGFGGGKELYY